MGNSGKILGLIALLIAIGALGLGVYQTFFTIPDDGPEIFIVSNEEIINLDTGGWKDIPKLNITYNTEVGDLVLFEYTCQYKLDIIGTTSLQICFFIDSVRINIEYYIYIIGVNAEDSQDIYNSGIMKYYIQYSSTGAHTVGVTTWIDDSFTATYVTSSVLKVEIY